ISPSLLERAGVRLNEEIPISPSLLERAGVRLNDNLLLPLYKILSPEHLLKQPFANDSNSLNQEFYNELLHIMGLEEISDGGKKIIVRQLKDRNEGSLIENTINLLVVQGKWTQINYLSEFGDTEEEQIFSIALELIITWLNRVLFLKLLEGQLIKYYQNSEKHVPTNAVNPAFLHSNFIFDFNDLDELFFEVLALETHQRSQNVSQKYGNLPYLNSSLFEETDLEKQTFHINSLKHRLGMPFYEQTVLKDIHGKTITDKKGQENKIASSTLDYLFRFLDAYDFASEPTGEIRANSKTMINAAVLGLIFEKINGYKDGSFFTPGFVTMYMCRETIARAVVQKFSNHFKEKFENISDLKSYIASKIKWNEVYKLNEIVNKVRICDPAVGSGHFLVSALNELIAIKSELGILVDKNNHIIQGLSIRIDNDELEINIFGEIFNYNFHNKLHQNIQETIFNEKQILIENCIFGVDINAKSVMICRLRLWIELLKNMYYRPQAPEGGMKEINSDFPGILNLNNLKLQTLPNLDINIKVGNSLVSRFDLKNNFLSKNEASRKKQTLLINKYKEAVFLYKKVNDKKLKTQVIKQIKELKEEFKDLVIPNDADYKKLKETKGKLEQIVMTFDSKDREMREQLVVQLAHYENVVKEKQQTLYGNAFEWRFEFPEVLDENGDFIGFDVVVANPPYGVKIKESQLTHFKIFYSSFEYQVNSYVLFYEQGIKLLSIDGFLDYITPATFTYQHYFKKIRSVLDEKSIIRIRKYQFEVFKEANVGDTVSYLLHNNKVFENKVKIVNSNTELLNSSKFKEIDRDNLYFKDGSYNLNNLKVDIEKINSKSILLGTIAKIIMGIKPYQVGKGTPKQNSASLINRVFSSTFKKDNTFLKYIIGKDFNRYCFNILEDRFLSYGKWLAEPRESASFFTDKIIIRQTSDRIIANFDNLKLINLNNVYNVTLNVKEFELKYILSILNSKLVNAIYQSISQEKGRLFAEVKKIYLEKLPIPNIPLKAQKPFVKLVDKILIAKETDPKADTQIWENEIDTMVYELYQLTTEEIATVEESFGKK
ncbi:MAG: type II restriction endonuclease, partial [Cytophagales bacterium]